MLRLDKSDLLPADSLGTVEANHPCWDFSGAGPTGRKGLLAQGHRAAVTTLDWAPTEGAARMLVSGDAAGDVALWRLEPSHRPGDRIRPAWTAATGDPAEVVAGARTGIVSGYRSGLVYRHERPAR